MQDNTVAVAQGVTLSTNRVERAIQKFSILKNEQMHSIGNNMYRTKIIRKLGFTDDPIAMESFYRKIITHGFKWITDIPVISTHLHPNGILNAVSRNKRFYSLRKDRSYLDNLNPLRYRIDTLASPPKAFLLALKCKEPRLQLFYPLSKLALTFTYFKKRMHRKASKYT